MRLLLWSHVLVKQHYSNNDVGSHSRSTMTLVMRVHRKITTERQTHVDRPITCSSFTLEHEQRLKIMEIMWYVCMYE